MNDKLTLLIPTHNRHQYLSKALSFYQNVDFQVIVADSTRTPYEKVDHFPNVKYLHFPEASYSSKLPAALTHITTPYVVMCADDDFLVLDTLYKCLNFLETNPDYSVAMGAIIYFSEVGEKRIELSPVYKGNLEYHIKDDAPFDRLKKVFANYRTVYYGLHRTEILKAAFFNTEETKNLLLYEYISALYPVMAGKIIAFPELYQIREYAGIPQRGIPNIDQVFTDEYMRSEFENLLNQQSAVISAKTGYSQDLIRSNLKEALEGYAKHYELPFLLYIKSRLKVWGVWFLLSDRLNFFPINSIKSIINNFRVKNIVSHQNNKELLARIKQFIIDYRHSDKA